MNVQSIEPTIRLLALEPGIPGYDRFFATYLLSGEKNAIVDVGPAAALPSLLSALADLGMSPGDVDYIVLTHIHIDHSGGIGAAAREMRRARVVAHDRALRHLIDPTKLWEASQRTLGDLAIEYGRPEPVPEDRMQSAAGLTTLDLGRGLVFDVLLTPGHAPHHLSLFEPSNRMLIAGEAAGVCIDGTVRLSTPPPFDLEETLASIDMLAGLEPERICYAHFGCYDDGVSLLNVARERLLSWHSAVARAVEAEMHPEDILIALREQDSSLDYLSTLGPEEYQRERKMLVNSIIGLSGQPR
jgi:glyoxylase-like metal-dependent hydrolase (beta-lactamase superfamily II)